MQMMSVLKPIAFDVLICLSQLFDYYLYAVSLLMKVIILIYFYFNPHLDKYFTLYAKLDTIASH